jgi:hypothetical protein
MPTAKDSLCITGHKKTIFFICDLPEDADRVGTRNTVSEPYYFSPENR